ncbi:hypothetical protein ASE48_10100 [Mycobacterium sp. Root265]|uniref:hypothetical protein n=1 Tax=Mycobacterium sp. Root265 TaxID=1736504 RepID=UPI000709EB30|nr:hypothetical protein [Mycobacterium sp. Root265]KRD07779.1 hypothetical protein ASE48_10100 [Mycobacterium sp. Root265]
MRRLIDEDRLELLSPEGIRRITQASLYRYLRDRVEELLVGLNELGETLMSLEASDAAYSQIEQLERENERLRNSLLVQRQNYAALADDLGAYTAPKLPNN